MLHNVIDRRFCEGAVWILPDPAETPLARYHIDEEIKGSFHLTPDTGNFYAIQIKDISGDVTTINNN